MALLLVSWICFCMASDPNVSPESSVTDPCTLEPSIQKWAVWHFWKVLQPGMRKERIIDLLGEPMEKESTETACIWYYQQAPYTDDSGVVHRPRFGLLNFKKSLVGGQEVMLLKLWKEPDWNQVVAYSAQQYQEEAERIEKLRQEQLQRQKELEEKRKREADEKRRQEELKRQQAQMEQQRQAELAAQQEKEFSWDKIPKTYWYTGGGVALGLILAFILIKKPFAE